MEWNSGMVEYWNDGMTTPTTHDDHYLLRTVFAEQTQEDQGRGVGHAHVQALRNLI